jgi:general secretion pathway protein F
LADPHQRRRWHDRLLRLPLLGELLSRMDTARFTRTLALLIDSGIDLPQALRLSTDVVENLALRQRLQQALPALESGHGLGALLATSNALPALAVEMIKVGEAAGQLVTMLDKVADEYEARVSGSIRRLLAMLEPVLVIGLGLMVAGIIASILIAVLDANQLLL